MLAQIKPHCNEVDVSKGFRYRIMRENSGLTLKTNFTTLKYLWSDSMLCET